MVNTLQPTRTDYSKRSSPNWDSNPNSYFKPASSTRPKSIYLRKEELNKYAEKWETLPQAYEFVMANQDLLMNLSPKETIDLYSRISFYSKTTHGKWGISKEACKKLAKEITTKHPELNKNVEKSKSRLKHEAEYIVPALFKTGEYHYKYSSLGSRFKTSSLKSKTDSPQITSSRNYFYGDTKRVGKLKGIEVIAQQWATQ